MNKKINEMLEEEIKTQIQNLSTLKSGSDEKSNAVDDLTKLYKLSIEEKKLQSDSEERNEEMQSKKEQLKEQKIDGYFRLGLAAAEIVLPLVFYGFWMRKGFKFEETGAYTSTTFRGLFSRFKPTKK